jgi:hypothetical protein
MSVGEVDKNVRPHLLQQAPGKRGPQVSTTSTPRLPEAPDKRIDCLHLRVALHHSHLVAATEEVQLRADRLQCRVVD